MGPHVNLEVQIRSCFLKRWPLDPTTYDPCPLYPWHDKVEKSCASRATRRSPPSAKNQFNRKVLLLPFQAGWNCLFPLHSKLNGLVSSFLFQAEWNCLSPFHSKAALVKFGPQELSRSNLSQADSGRLKWCLTIPLFNTS